MSDFLLIAFPAACFTTMVLIVVCACIAGGRADRKLEGLRHSEAQEGTRAVAGRPLSPVTARGALGNADMRAQSRFEDTALRSMFFGPSEDYMAPFDRELAEVVQLDARRIRRANRGHVA